MKGLSLLSLCFVVILAQPARAAELEFPNGKPTVPMNAPDSDHYWEILVVHDEVELCEAPYGKDCAPVTGQWLKHYVVGDWLGDYLLLVSIDDDRHITRFHGWVHKKYLQYSNTAMRNPNRIFDKVMVVNYWRQLEPGQGQELDLKRATAWNGLHDNKKKVMHLSLFEIFFVYQKQEDHYLVPVQKL